jgi:hypothetical protein
MNVDRLFFLIHYAMPDIAPRITEQEIENLAELLEQETKHSVDQAVKEERKKCVVCEKAMAEMPWGEANTEVYHSQAKFISQCVAAMKAGRQP